MRVSQFDDECKSVMIMDLWNNFKKFHEDFQQKSREKQ